MFPKSVFTIFGCKYPSFGFYQPIFVTDTVSVFVRMATVCPCSELLVGYGVYCCEGFFAHLSRQISGPSHNDWVQFGFQRLLWCRFVSSYLLSQPFHFLLHFLFTCCFP